VTREDRTDVLVPVCFRKHIHQFFGSFWTCPYWKTYRGYLYPPVNPLYVNVCYFIMTNYRIPKLYRNFQIPLFGQPQFKSICKVRFEMTNAVGMLPYTFRWFAFLPTSLLLILSSHPRRQPIVLHCHIYFGIVLRRLP